MAIKRNRSTSGTLQIRVESGKFVLADNIASKISNMRPTEEGTLRSLRGPSPYLPYYPAFTPPSGVYPMQLMGLPRGLFHAIIKRYNRDILLLDSGGNIFELHGWSHGWKPLIGTLAGVQIQADIVSDIRPRFPTQFEATDQGVIIVPREGRAYFYDGKCVAPLGYTEVPGPPTGHGPRSKEDFVTFARLQRGAFVAPATYNSDKYIYGEEIDLGAKEGEADPLLNNLDYAHDAQQGFKTSMHKDFGVCRVGTVAPNPGDVGVEGIVKDSRFRAAVQWIDRWGNLSPIGGQSDDVYITEQPSFTYSGDPSASPPTTAVGPGKVDLVLKQIAWTNIEPGPERTIGRVLCRTKDLNNSGTAKLFSLRAYAAEGGQNFATIPDNEATLFPDNVPDAWLFNNPPSPLPIPAFKLTRLAFGRHFIANIDAEDGLVRWSMPNKWGTFLPDDFIFPDATGKEITGLWRCKQGLLVFTSDSTYLVTPNDSGQGFRSQTISATVGCSAPSSLATLEDGTSVWLGRYGFYAFTGEGVRLISDPIARTINTLNQARLRQACAAVDLETGEYRCWVPQYSSRANTLCLIYDGVGWRERTDVTAASVCVTRDHRHYMLAAGISAGTFSPAPPSPPAYSVWTLDHENQAFVPNRGEAVVETAWLTGLADKDRATPLTVYLWLRETKSKLAVTPNFDSSSPTLTLEVARDWRETTIQTVTANLIPDDDVPPFYAETILGSGSSWVRRRPYWVRAMIYVPSCEVFKLRLKNKGDWEFLGLVFDEQPKKSGGARIPISNS